MRNEMGIGFHIKDYDCKARWSYSGFHRFRKKVASSVGLILEIDKNFKWIEQDWNKWDRDWLIFLTHSDCDGYFTAYRCGRIAEKLKTILQKWKCEEFMEKYDFDQAMNLVEAMEHCKTHKKKMRIS